MDIVDDHVDSDDPGPESTVVDAGAFILCFKMLLHPILIGYCYSQN